MIRRAGVDDARALAELNAVVQAVHLAARPDYFHATSEDEVAAWLAEQLAKPTTLAWIAEEGDRSTGYVLAFIRDRPANPFCAARRHCEIDQIAVRPDRHRAGVGRALIDQVVESARAAGVHDIELCAWSFNEPAQAAFRSYGFVPKVIRFEMI